MPLETILAAVAAGATLVTPNNRLARRLAAAHDRARLAGGARTWAAVQALPWGAWVDGQELVLEGGEVAFHVHLKITFVLE